MDSLGSTKEEYVKALSYTALLEEIGKSQAHTLLLQTYVKNKEDRIVRAIDAHDLIDRSYSFSRMTFTLFSTNILTVVYTRDSGYETYEKFIKVPVDALDTKEAYNNWITPLIQKKNAALLAKKEKELNDLITQKQKELDTLKAKLNNG